MTTTTSPLTGERDEHRAPTDAQDDINRSFSLNRSTALILMYEALSRARLLEATQARTRSGAFRPARVVALAAAAKRRESLSR